MLLATTLALALTVRLCQRRFESGELDQTFLRSFSEGDDVCIIDVP